MRIHLVCLTGALALAVLLLITSPAGAQNSVAQNAAAQNGGGQNAGGNPPRMQARGQAPREPQPVAANTRPGQTAPRSQADTDAAAGKAAPPMIQPKGPAKAPASPPAPVIPKGFDLTESQQKLLDQILIKWEQQSDKVKTYSCEFSRWEYDPTWGPKKFDYQTSKAKGVIRYSAPDQGEFQITEMFEFDPKKVDYVSKADELDHWLCTGKAIFEFNSKKKQLIERRLPEALQGKAITDGPLPFIFGAKADQLKRRYWMKDATPKEEIGKTIWLEAIPKFQQDAANYQRATVVLNEADFMPYALRIFLPGGKSDTAYKFDHCTVNGLLDNWKLTAPRLSAAQALKGWKHIVEKDPAEEQKSAPAPPEEPKQAKRPVAPPKRK